MDASSRKSHCIGYLHCRPIFPSLSPFSRGQQLIHADLLFLNYTWMKCPNRQHDIQLPENLTKGRVTHFKAVSIFALHNVNVGNGKWKTGKHGVNSKCLLLSSFVRWSVV